MRKTSIASLYGLLLILVSCKPESEPIHYGHDNCHFCMMSIVDQRFGCEMVTKKGKVYKFDAVECMINFINKKPDNKNKPALLLSDSYDNPGKFVDARKAHYLISKKMPSPMGMYINPFSDLAEARKMQQQNGGKIFSWTELKAKLAN